MKKSILLCLVAVFLTACLAFFGCTPVTPDSTGDSTAPQAPVLPLEKAGCVKEFTLDVYTQESATVNPQDYVDANGLTDLTYSLTVANDTLVSVTEENGSFVILPVAEGNTGATLKTVKANEVLLEIALNISVISTAPGAPTVSQSTFTYDKAAGGKFEIPVEMNGGVASILRINDERVRDSLWAYNAESGCIEVDESAVMALALGEYTAIITTTGGSVEFTVNVINSITTSFDEVTAKDVAFGKDEYAAFNITLNEATVQKVTFGEIELKADEDYAVVENQLRILSSFFKKTSAGDEREYTVYLSNNDSYSFTVNVVNHLFYTDYDVTTVHNDLQSTTGQNPVYQDSTRVEIVNAPENSGLSGRVLKFTPHTEDVPLDVHGIYTLQSDGGSSTWLKLRFKPGASYVVSFDYMTEGTTAGENFGFRSWTNGLKCAVDTANPGTLQHFSYTFKWEDSQCGTFVYGKFINGGCIYIDNYSIIEISESEVSMNPGDYKSEDTYIVPLSLAGYAVREVLIDNISVDYQIIDGNLVIEGEIIKALPYNVYTLTVVTDLFKLESKFNHKDPTQKAELYEKAKTFVHGTQSIKLSGLFTNGVTVTSAFRQGANNLDWINGTWQAISVDYFEVAEDGLIVKKGLLDQSYLTCTYSVYLSNNVEIAFTLTSNALWFCNFDETYTWHGSLAEDPGVFEVVSGIDGMTGNVLKIETKNWSVNAPWTWYTRVFCFQKTGFVGGTWNDWPMQDDKSYEISFDMKVIMNGADHNPAVGLGYYYTIGTNGEQDITTDYTDEKVHRITVTIKGSDFGYFAIGLDPRHGDLQSILYLDNFQVKEVIA